MRQIVLAAAALTAGAALAQSHMKPGLWEINQSMRTGSGQMEQQAAQMQQQMANMPPEQRAMVEQMMAQRGMKLNAGGPGGMSMKVCMTREMVERREMPTNRGECKTTRQAMSGNTMNVAFTCVNPASSGEGQFTFSSPESYDMKMVVNTTVQGKPETMNMNGHGKWLGGDCGSIQPIRPPAK